MHKQSPRQAFQHLALVALAIGAQDRCIAATTEPNPIDGSMSMDPAQGVQEHSFDSVIAPIPISNPTVGSGLGLAAMLLYKTDEKSPESFTGLGGAYTSSGSWAAALAEKLYLDEDRYRVTAGIMYGELNYDFFGVGEQTTLSQGIPLEQTIFATSIDVRRKFYDSLYLGLKWRYAHVTTASPANSELDALLQGKDLDIAISGLGIVASWDTRDRTFDPRSGQYAEFTSNFARKSIGSDLQYETYSLAVNTYHTLREADVFAARFYTCNASADAPFFDTCAFGSGVDLRGYPAGRYRDRVLVAGQGEYRLTLSERFGAVAFAGAGAVAKTFDALGDSTLLPDVGVGLRYLVVPKQGVRISADYAWGKGSSGFYVYIGEAF